MPKPRIPKLPVENARCEYINISVSESEKAMLRDIAARSGTPLAVWVREAALRAANEEARKP